MPDWKAVHQSIDERVLEGQALDEAWHEVVREWCTNMGDALRAPYRTYESRDAFVVCAQPERMSITLVRWVSHVLRTLTPVLGEIVPEDLVGKTVVFIFDDRADYYEYVAAFYPDGDHAFSGGVCLNCGYVHVAMPFTSLAAAEPVLVHEIAHTRVSWRRLPVWINEGLVQLCEERVLGHSGHFADDVRAHASWFWSRDTLADFWKGRTFDRQDVGPALSYHLARALVRLLATDWSRFKRFACAAKHQDAGRAALAEHYDLSLEQLAAKALASAGLALEDLAPREIPPSAHPGSALAPANETGAGPKNTWSLGDRPRF